MAFRTERAGRGTPPQFLDICQSRLSLLPWTETRTRKLPGINPVEEVRWLIRDDVFDLQMAYRDFLIDSRQEAVFQSLPEGEPVARELLEHVLEAVGRDPAYRIDGSKVTRPDGEQVEVHEMHSLLAVGRLVQEDFCLMKRYRAEHFLVGGVLCFPASWMLGEKMGRSLTTIHEPVTRYTPRIAAGVQRIFDNLRPGRVVFRANYLSYSNPNLHQPRSIDDRRDKNVQGDVWIRVERQTLRKLPDTEGIVFGIHTSVCRREAVPGLDESLTAWQGL
ncbi:MAG: DUF3445 domain-containing protein [Rhodobacteraceae bacterium]|nr:DUF3445 domain-containing protein [Paracoccaceae bacterium]